MALQEPDSTGEPADGEAGEGLLLQDRGHITVAIGRCRRRFLQPQKVPQPLHGLIFLTTNPNADAGRSCGAMLWGSVTGLVIGDVTPPGLAKPCEHISGLERECITA